MPPTAPSPTDPDHGRRHDLGRAHGCTERSHTVPATKPTAGAIVNTPATPSTPTGLMPSQPPQSTEPAPPSASAAPTRPPSSACPELDGSPRHQVSPFHATAPVSAAPRTGITWSDGTVTIPAIVLATALPSRRGPRTLPVAARSTAVPGRA